METPTKEELELASVISEFKVSNKISDELRVSTGIDKELVLSVSTNDTNEDIQKLCSVLDKTLKASNSDFSNMNIKTNIYNDIQDLFEQSSTGEVLLFVDKTGISYRTL